MGKVTHWLQIPGVGFGVAGGAAMNIWPTQQWIAYACFFFGLIFIFWPLIHWCKHVYIRSPLYIPTKNINTSPDQLPKLEIPVDIEFRESKQAVAETDQSWLHIRVALKEGSDPSQIIERATIKCRVTLEEDNHITGNAAFGMTEQPLDEIRDMRWQSQDNPKGESSVTIEHGRPKFIPDVRRWEKTSDSPSVCFLTDQSFLMGHQVNTLVKLIPGLYSIIFTVKAAQNKQWESPMYVLAVPKDETSNGHFILEKYYKDEA